MKESRQTKQNDISIMAAEKSCMEAITLPFVDSHVKVSQFQAIITFIMISLYGISIIAIVASQFRHSL
jgi:hypothetical protein